MHETPEDVARLQALLDRRNLANDGESSPGVGSETAEFGRVGAPPTPLSR
jgi:hypothetical protein